MSVATDAVDRIHTTAQSHHRVMIIETMGRYAGWIALRSAIAGGGDIVLIPEIPYNEQVIVDYILGPPRQRQKFQYFRGRRRGQKRSLENRPVTRTVAASTDPVRLGGIGFKISNMVEEACHVESRVVVLGTSAARRHADARLTAGLSTAFRRAAPWDPGAGRQIRPTWWLCRGWLSGECKIADAISKLKLVDPNSEEVKTALEVGMSFGSAQIG